MWGWGGLEPHLLPFPVWCGKWRQCENLLLVWKSRCFILSTPSSLPGAVVVFVHIQGKPLPPAAPLWFYHLSPPMLMQGIWTWQTMKPRTLQSKTNVELTFRKQCVCVVDVSRQTTWSESAEEHLTACHHKPLRYTEARGHTVFLCTSDRPPWPWRHRSFNCTVDHEFQ